MPQYQGIWTLAQAAQLQSTQRWATDPLFENTTLLLQADNAANGAQNNTFLDSSSNNFTITRNGNTTQGTFTPYSLQPGAWSNFNPDSDNGIGVASNTALNMGTGDFTVEAWVNTAKLPTTNAFQTSSGGYQCVFGTGPNVSATGTQLYIGVTNLFFDISSDGSGPISVAHSMVAGQWYHIAISRSGTTFRAFINGVLVQTATSSSSWVDGYNYGIMRAEPIGGYSGAWWYGYVSNFRLVKGTAVYTSNFTPSPIPLTAITNTSLLTCQSNRFSDNSTNAFAITANGTPSVQAFSPFAPQYQYTPSVTGGSGYFDGTGDYLTVPDNAAFTVGSGDYTLEAWVYPTASPNQPIILGQWSGGANGSIVMMLSNDANRYLRGLVYSGGYVDRVSTSSLQLNAWNHCAFVREGTYLNLYLNGTRVENYNWGSSSIQDSSLVVSTGASSSGSQPFQGNISNARFVKGTALYSGTTYTIPTAPLTNITNTSLLLNFTNAGIYDGTLKNNLETVGNAQVSTSVVKYGTGSMYFDGTGDYLVTPFTQLFNMWQGDSTVECWAYFNSLANTPHIWTIGEASIYRVTLYVSGSVLRLYTRIDVNAGDRITSTTTLSTGRWYHVALTKNSGTWTLWLDGISQGTSTTTVFPFGPAENLGVGFQQYNGVSGDYLNGYIDDLRITRGIARYTANFTPPTVALPRQ